MTSFPTIYDAAIQAACAKYLEVDWRLLKAQYFQESRLDPTAVSPVGARGIPQFMPATWAEVAKALDIPQGVTPANSEHAIPAGAYYMAQMRAIWSWPRPEADRYALALASYNAGAGNILKAQRAANMASGYAPVIAKLHEVTGNKNASETRTYVRRIFGYYAELITG